jgi:hypothetical protein
MELTSGGEQMNIPMVARLAGTAIGSGTLAGNEEAVKPIVESLQGASYVVSKVEQKDKVEKASPPFTTRFPPAFRLTSIVLSALSPRTVSTPPKENALTVGVIRLPSCSKVAVRLCLRVFRVFGRRRIRLFAQCVKVVRDIVVPLL